MSLLNPLPCPGCGQIPNIEYDYCYVVICPRCWDADRQNEFRGYDLKRDQAIEYWNEFVEERTLCGECYRPATVTTAKGERFCAEHGWRE